MFAHPRLNREGFIGREQREAEVGAKGNRGRERRECFRAGYGPKSKGPLDQAIDENEDQKDDLQEDQRIKRTIRRRVRAQGKEEKHAMLPSLHVLEET